MMAEVARLLPVHYRGHYTEAAMGAPQPEESAGRRAPLTGPNPI